LAALVAGVQEEMHMRVDEAGHQCRIAEIDDRGSSGSCDVRARFANAIAHNEHFAGRENLAISNVENMRRVQNSGGSRGLLCLSG
jgi:hypothetical protein